MLSRRAFLKLSLKTTLSATLLASSGLAYAHTVEPFWVDITHLRLTLPRLAAAFDGYRLLQISDIHADAWMTAERLQTCVELVNQQQPDLVAITGDFVTPHPEQVANHLLGPLRRLQARDGVLAVLGNHDHWTAAESVRHILQQTGVAELCNTVHTLRRGSDMLHIAGVDDVWVRQARLGAVLGQLPPQGAAVLLAHEPDYADVSAPTQRFDLQISGHSHGGQVRLPGSQAPVLPYLARRYPAGLYQVGTMLQYTNRGLGMTSMQVRFNCRPEITVFTLEAAA
jgi:hypothetical protein